MANSGRIIFLILIITLFSITYAQDENNPRRDRDFSNVKTKITGKTIDAETEKPLESVTVQLYSMKDTNSVVTGSLTNNKGEFFIEDFKPGRYELRISFIGYNTVRIKDLRITPAEPEMSVGDIMMRQGSDFITSEIEVTAEKNLMEFGIDKKVFNVEKDIVSQSGTAIDVLKNVPSVSVDSEGNISLRGSGNIKILLNGKPSGLLSTNPLAILDQIPANTIDRIEIINNPSAKYDPEGMAGIINIVLKKEQTDNSGYNYTLNVNAGTGDRYNLTTGLSYRKNNWNFYGNYSFRLFNMNMTGGRTVNNYFSDSSYYYSETDNNKMRMLGHLGTLGFDFDINDKNYVGFNASYNYRDRERNQNTVYNNFDPNMNPTYFYSRIGNEPEIDKGVDATLNYRLGFDKPRHEIVSFIQFSSSRENEDLSISQQNLDFNGNVINAPVYQERNFNTEKLDQLTISADYTNPLKQEKNNGFKITSKFEAGFRSNLKDLESDFKVDSIDNNTGNWILDRGRSNDFLYKEQIHAIYATYENTYKKFGYQIGLRLEQAFTKSEQRTLNQNYENNYFSYFPSIFLKQGISETTELQLSLNRRINRPRTRFLNPFPNTSDPQSVRVGNPNLKPEYINGAEFGFVKYFNAITLTSSVFYRLTQDMISRYVTTDSNGFSTMTFVNINNSKNYGLELIGIGSFTKWWNLNTSFSYYRTEIKGNINSAELNSNGYSWSAKLISNMSLPNLFDIQLSYYYHGKNVTPQGSFDPMQSLDIAVKKDFLDRRMSIGLRISDVFKTQNFKINFGGDTFNSRFERYRDSRAAYLTFSYRVGTDTKKKKPRERKPEERDQQPDIDF